ncbi:MAG: DUF4147 domain-containing protein [Planctomycetia bacterium]|nr:DUF4147 domain-containing protein [Planctomycetia bacterium]
MTPAAITADVDCIRTAAIDAVRPESLVPTRITLAGRELLLDGKPFSPPVALRGRVIVVGGGKAAAGVAAAVERLLAAAVSSGLQVAGLVSVPEGSGRRLAHVEVRETRPLAANLPTPAAVAASREMRGMLAECGAADLAIVIVTGGGSALIEEPRDGVSLAGTIALVRHLSGSGASIRDLNTVRQPLSIVKAGGLARECSAGRMVTLVLSDIIGDSLDLIASGPCMPVIADPAAALDVLRRYAALDVDPAITRLLEREASAARSPFDGAASAGGWTTPRGCRVSHVLLGTNATAVEAAAAMARRLGYETVVQSTSTEEESADSVGGRLARDATLLSAAAVADGRPRAIIEGGEATVVLPRDHGLGGRNQQTVLAALAAWSGEWPRKLAVASIGTDGEDGPTDAAGGMVDAEVAAAVATRRLDVATAVRRCDAHPLLDAVGGLIRTGPTGTNVADVRLILARP